MDTRAGLTAKATINRYDFGLGQGIMVQSAASKTAKIEVALEAVQKPLEAREAVAKVD